MKIFIVCRQLQKLCTHLLLNVLIDLDEYTHFLIPPNSRHQKRKLGMRLTGLCVARRMCAHTCSHNIMYVTVFAAILQLKTQTIVTDNYNDKESDDVTREMFVKLYV